jgi:hypothetical protein
LRHNSAALKFFDELRWTEKGEKRWVAMIKDAIRPEKHCEETLRKLNEAKHRTCTWLRHQNIGKHCSIATFDPQVAPKKPQQKKLIATWRIIFLISQSKLLFLHFFVVAQKEG